MMELGNMMFGNSRGSHEVDRRLQDEFCGALEAMGFDSYGHHDLSNDEGLFENEVFAIRPYYWGDCTCGFETLDWAWSKANRHADDCYQSKLKRAKIAAGGVSTGEFGYVSAPESIDYDQWDEIEQGIYDTLCAEHGLDPNRGCAVHCTCTHDSDYEAWRGVNDHKPDCALVQPNFLFKPTGFRLDWYKYPLRDSYSSQPLTRNLMRRMLTACAESMGAVA